MPNKHVLEPISDPKQLISTNLDLNNLDDPKRKFVELYRQLMGHITNTCAGCGISRGTYYNWLDSDKNFALAVAEAEAELNDEIREVLIQKAGEGDMTAVIFYLKNRHPDFKQAPYNLIQVNNFKESSVKEQSEYEI